MAPTSFLHFRDASVFTKKSGERIGRVYKKTVYREFTDASFRQQKTHRKDLGIIGPVLRGEVGDTIKIVYKVGALWET